ncbi:MAG: hypothetical protein AB1801_07275 [Chloroflexota bacterium]
MEMKLLLIYNIKPSREAEYYRYVMGEFLPLLQNLGMYMIEGWHTAYGNYPVRLIAFQVNSETEIQTILKNSEWQKAKERLLKLVRDYEERVVPAKKTFQFFIPDRRER